MLRRPFTRTRLVLLSLALTACASDPTPSPRAEERYAVIETGASRKADGIFPVLLTRLDDRRIPVTSDDLRRGRGGYFPNARTTFRVRPGVHVLEAMALVDRNAVPGVSRDLSRPNDTPLEHNFQAGTRYFVGIEADSPRRAGWRLVIWKTEEIEEGQLQLRDR